MTQLPCEKPTLFKGRHFNHLFIIRAVRWHATYKLSYCNVCDLRAERGVTVVHPAVLRWVQRFVPAFEKKRMKYARPVCSPWRVDETYIKVKGQWRHPYRAVDKQGQTVDFLLSKNRDQAAAARFFKKQSAIMRPRRRSHSTQSGVPSSRRRIEGRRRTARSNTRPDQQALE